MATHTKQGRKRLAWEPADTVLSAGAALLVAVFGIFALLVWQGYDFTIDRAENRAQAGARSLALLAATSLASAELVLTSIDVGETLASPGDADRAAQAPRLLRYGAGGDLTGDAAADAADNALFEDLRSGTALALSARADLPGVRIGRRLEADGGFAGAIILALPDNYLEEVWHMLGLGVQSTVSLVRTDGHVVGRFPPPELPVDLAGLPSLARFVATEQGVYVSPASPVDGIARIVGFHAVPGYDLIALASVSQEAVLGELWSAVRTVLLLMLPIGAATLLGTVATARLLRRSRRTELRLQTALDENSVLLREIHHRVKNNLQSVNALINLHNLPQQLKADLSSRLSAMSAVHEHIYRSDDFHMVDLDGYLRTLTEKLRQGVGQHIRFVERFEPMQVPSETATPLGLIFSEVVMNAVKHAFADGRDGVVSIALERLPDDRARLTIADNGMGLAPDAPATGIGRKLIRALAGQVLGELSVHSGAGTRYELEFPIDAASAG